MLVRHILLECVESAVQCVRYTYQRVCKNILLWTGPGHRSSPDEAVVKFSHWWGAMLEMFRLSSDAAVRLREETQRPFLFITRTERPRIGASCAVVCRKLHMGTCDVENVDKAVLCLIVTIQAASTHGKALNAADMAS